MSKRFFSIYKSIKGDEITPRLCRDCKHFQPDNFYFLTHNRFEFGRCKKSKNVNLISGKTNYDYASIVRKHHCQENWYESKWLENK
jgi:hypothetical protein